MRSTFTNFLLLIIIVMSYTGCQPPSETNESEVLEGKIQELLDQMTLEEKVGMIHASSPFTSGGVERLGVPELITSDGPHGVRHEHGRDWVKDEDVYDSSTYLPVGTALAATWNRDLGYKFGTVLGSEANFRGKDIILGPGLNIIRSPLNGRNFEYMTEDPYLNAQMAIGYVKGVQDQGVAACAKHYVANTLEIEREYINVEMDERTLQEIYLPAYKAAVQEGGVHTIMAAYNKFRGTYCAHNGYLLDDILRKDWGFDGLVISDWAAVKSTEAVKVGMDIEFGTDLDMMPGPVDYGKFFMGDTVVSMVKNGQLDESLVDAKVRNILRVMHRIDKFGERQPGAYNTPEHQAIARKIADEAMVLLKNDGVLPLDKSKIKKLAIVGANATWKHAGAGGSSQVKAYYEVTSFQGIENSIDAEIDFSQGYEVSRTEVASDDMIADAVKSVSESDAAIYVGGLIHGWTDEWNDNAFDAEVVDKPDMYLPFGQNKLIKALLEANPNTVIVLIDGGPVDMSSWIGDAKAIVQAWYAGMEGGNALADILFGETNPSGKLPMSFPKKLEDSPAHSLAQYPGEDLLIDHKEGVFVGYRYFDSYEVEPAFPFGHGLSYTTFEYQDLSLSKSGNTVNVSIEVTNSGEMKGSEVIQVYVRDNESSVERPEKELKGFEKVELAPGESKSITIQLGEDSFKFYDEISGGWILEGGEFTLFIGSSSRDIRLTGTINM